jgi:hypothetical protein
MPKGLYIQYRWLSFMGMAEMMDDRKVALLPNLCRMTDATLNDL